jgi:hypothetical protein
MIWRGQDAAVSAAAEASSSLQHVDVIGDVIGDLI